MPWKAIKLERFHTVALPRAEVWRLLAETDHLNRVIGLFPVLFSPVKRHTDGPYRLAFAKVANLIPIVWREYPFQWVVEQEHVVERVYESGPLLRFVAGVELRDATDPTDAGEGRGAAVGHVGDERKPEAADLTGDAAEAETSVGTTIRFYAEVTPRNLLGYIATHLVGSNSMRNSIEYLNRHLSGKAAALARPQTGKKPIVNHAELNRLLQGLSETPVRREYIPIVRNLITNHDDDEVVGVRPYELARYHDVNGHELLRLFLYATKLGIFNLSWNMMCPNCRVSKFQATSLADVSSTFHCDFCGIAYETNFDNYVELRFSVHPNIRSASEAIYCIGGPAITPHILVQRCVAGGESAVIRYPNTRHALRIRLLQSNHIVRIEGDFAGLAGVADFAGMAAFAGLPGVAVGGPTNSGDGHSHELTFTNEGWLEESLANPAAGEDIIIKNGTGDTIVVVLERIQWSEDAVTAAEVTAMQEFRDLFSSEVLAPGQQVGVENVTIFFSDLRNSTAMYENIGDAMAYGHVRKHFDFLGDWIARNSGSLVKTIGDAVMAVFHRPQEAVEAALQIQRHAAEFSLRVGEPIEIKIGIHTGPAIAVNSNDRLDYFGRTVNIAARVQGYSEGGDIVLTEETCSYAEVRAVIEAALGADGDVLSGGAAGAASPEPLLPRGAGAPGAPVLSRFRARLKGINEEHDLVRITVPSAGAALADPSGAIEDETHLTAVIAEAAHGLANSAIAASAASLSTQPHQERDQD